MKAVIEIDVPDYQIGQEVNIYFPDTMQIKGIVKQTGKEKHGRWEFSWSEQADCIIDVCSNCGKPRPFDKTIKWCSYCGSINQDT